ncbi:hypothetical protein QFC19_008977 [Naganishia cerealis]|uniref:Uncharacterized protein n=1 Tax=Naganishia cerealis TaxID=610337 RepID=A0ACC2UY69_9TREE|nr:hypothetical protein QFC19_008977 [Naganishia cerealis]
MAYCLAIHNTTPDAANSQNILGEAAFPSPPLDSSQQLQGRNLLPRDEPSSSSPDIILINPLTWQLSSSFDPSSYDLKVPDIVNQPKAVISSAFPVMDGSNYSPGLRVPPGWSFSVGFNAIFTPNIVSSNSLTDTQSSLTYSLRLEDGFDLPGWMSYNVEYMTLSGLTPWINPSEVSAPQIQYGLRMIATLTSFLPDGGTLKTAIVAQSFNLLVAFHAFECISNEQQPGSNMLNLTRGGERLEQPLAFGGVGGVTGIYLDSKQVTEEDITDAKVDVSWARIRPPTNLSPRLLILSAWDPGKSLLPVTLVDIHGETLDVLLKLKSQDSVFRYPTVPGWFQSCNLTIGQDFTVSLEQNLTLTLQVQQQKTLQVKNLPSWMSLRFDPLAVSGTVPSSITNQTLVSLLFRFTDPETFAVSLAKWNITLLSTGHEDDTGKVGNGNNSTADSSRSRTLSRRTIIIIAVLASLLGFGLVLCLAWFARKRYLAHNEEKRKWASVLLPGRSRHTAFYSPPSYTSNLKGQKPLNLDAFSHLQQPQPVYQRTSLSGKRSSSPSMLKAIMITAMSPTKKARQMAFHLKDRSKRYTKSFMSYPIDYPNTTPDVNQFGDQDKSTTEIVSFHSRASPSPSPQRPTSIPTSLAPFPFVDPPLSGLPSTTFTSDSFLHGHPNTASPASWEEPDMPAGHHMHP